MTATSGSAKTWEFNDAAKAAVYRAIYARRDIRGQFRGDPIPDDTLARILHAAHHAPSVGFMQPWNFLVIESREVRARVHAAFARANAEAALMFPEGKRERYQKFKLEGIMEAPLNLCITCDRSRFGPVVIGRTANRAMDLFSTVCAVQNLWLTARAEGLGVGWVSIVHDRDLREILGLPPEVVPVAYLCVGYVTHFPERPELQTAGWLPRLPLESLVAWDGWGNACETARPSLSEAIRAEAARHESGGQSSTSRAGSRSASSQAISAARTRSRGASRT